MPTVCTAHFIIKEDCTVTIEFNTPESLQSKKKVQVEQKVITVREEPIREIKDSVVS